MSALNVDSFDPANLRIDLANVDRIFATVGGVVFRTQDDLKKRTRELLHSYQPGEFVSPADWFFLLQLIRRHPDANDKIGVGVGHFQRRINKRDEWVDAPGFWIIRVDGTEEAFSIYECFRDRPPTTEERFLKDVIKCCRAAIAETIHNKKLEHFGTRAMVRCEALDVPMSFSEAQVDHSGEWPFIRIVDEWLEEIRPHFWELSIDNLPLGVKFSDRSVEEYFVRFHNTIATLRVVHKWINQSEGSNGYKMKFTIPERMESAA